MNVCSKIDELGLWVYVNHSVLHVHPVKAIVYKMDRNHSNRFCKFQATNKTLHDEKTCPIHIFCNYYTTINFYPSVFPNTISLVKGQEGKI